MGYNFNPHYHSLVSFTECGMEDKTKYAVSFASVILIINLRKLQAITKKITQMVMNC